MSRTEQSTYSTDPSADLLMPGLPFSAAELWAMERAGLVVHLLGELYLPADHPDAGRVAASPETGAVRVRAAAVRRLAAPVLTGRWAAMGLSAAWVHAGGPAPAALEVTVEHFQRVPLQPLSVGWNPEQTDAVRTPEDVMDLQGLPCTTPERTVEDLLRRVQDEQRAPAALSAAGRLVPLLPDGPLRERFEKNRRRPGMATARRALAELLAS